MPSGQVHTWGGGAWSDPGGGACGLPVPHPLVSEMAPARRGRGGGWGKMVAIPPLPTGAPRPHRGHLEFLLDGFQGLFRVLYSLQLWRLLTVRCWVGGGHTVDCPGSHAALRLGSLVVDTTSDFPRVTHGSLCVDSGAGLAHRAFPLAARHRALPLAARHRAHGLLPESRRLKETAQAERDRPPGGAPSQRRGH